MKKSKTRVDFRKNRSVKTRDNDLTRDYEQHGFEEENDAAGERIGTKGEHTRKRTVTSFSEGALAPVNRAAGLVLKVHGVTSIVQTADGRQYQCVTRRIIKTLTTTERQPVVTGDQVLFRIENETEGMIERVEPRRSEWTRTSKKRKHTIVSNVDQVLIIASTDEPDLKPNLIDRMLITAEQNNVPPVICINKMDLVNAAELQPMMGVYTSMGYSVLQLSVKTGQGIEQLRRLLRDKTSALTGQSGAGKSSLLNAVDEKLDLRIGDIGSANKGKHTTTVAELFELSFGGYVVDTPGLRQFELWDIIPEEVFGLFRDLRPYENRCKFPDCTHFHEDGCAVKYAVAEGRLDLRRYESYLNLRNG